MRHALIAEPTEDLAEVALSVQEDIVAVVAGFELFRLDAARVSQRLGVGLHDDLLMLTRMRFKSAQRQFLTENAPHLPQPRFSICSSVDAALESAEKIGYPVIVKPDDSGGSANVTLVADDTALVCAVGEMSASILDDGRPSNGIFLVEEAILGPEMGVQGVVDIDGRVQIVSVSSKVLNTDGGRFLERQHILQPPTAAPAVVEFATTTITALELVGSAFHMDVRLRDGIPFLIEAGARLSGAYIPLALATAGTSWAQASLDAATGGVVSSDATLKRTVAVELLTADSFAVPGLATIRTEGEALYIIDMERAINGDSYTHFGDRVGVKITVEPRPNIIDEKDLRA